MKSNYFTTTSIQLLKSARNYPIELITGLLFYIISFSEIENSWLILEHFFIFISGIYCLNKTMKTQKLRTIYYISALVPAILALFFSELLVNFSSTSAFVASNILAIILLCNHNQSTDNKTFASKILYRALSIIIAVGTGFLAFLAISMIYSSFIYIFDINSGNFYEYTMKAIMLIVVPQIAFYLIDNYDKTGIEIAKPLKIIINFILNPAIIIYTLILFAYAATILIRLELPKGKLAYMVLAFIVAAYTGIMSQTLVNKQHFKWFYQYFTYIAIVPLTMFWIGLSYRIGAYGFTESRIYLLAGGALITLFTIGLLSKKIGRFKHLLTASALLLALLSYIPVISAKDLGVASQENRMMSYARKLNVIDQKGKLYIPKSYKPQTNEKEEVKQLCEAYDYLKYRVTDYKNAYGTIEYKYKETIKNNQWFSCPNGVDLDISDYNHLYTDCKYSDGTLYYADKQVTIDLQAHTEKYYDTITEELKTTKYQINNVKPFIFRNDSIMAVFPGINYNSDDKEIDFDDRANVYVK